MFTRSHRIGRRVYIEALEIYQDPENGRSRHRCLVRWRAERSFAQELGFTRFEIERAAKDLAYYQGVIERTVRPRSPKQHKHAAEYATHWRRRLNEATAHLAALTAARDAGLPADDAEIQQAEQAEAQRWDKLMAGAATIFTPPPGPDLTELAASVRRLASYNDPEAMRAEIAAIAAALEAISPPATPL